MEESEWWSGAWYWNIERWIDNRNMSVGLDCVWIIRVIERTQT